jgi:predicted nucleic acid-binding protein
MVRTRQLILAETTPSMLARMPALMQQYRDLPMDLADASLVALAEEQRLVEVFTLDRDFRVYRLPDGRAFRVLP